MNNTSEWTPGPWKAERGNVGDRHPLFVVSPTTAFRPPCDADAYLIAAAPELYAALEVALDKLLRAHLHTGFNFSEVFAFGRTALAKARGEAVWLAQLTAPYMWEDDPKCAAAPDLYAALESVLSDMGSQVHMDPDVKEQGYAALAKARGEHTHAR